MKNIFLFCLVLLSGDLCSQSIRLITTDDIPGIVQIRYDTFAGKDLSRYLGVQANLFFEYGFREMCVTDYNLAGDNARLEVYIMNEPASAFGIYSVSTSMCNIRNLYSTLSCTSSTQVSAVTGPFYIRALNLSKTQNGLALCGQILQRLIQNNPQDPWYLPPLSQQPALSPYLNSLRYITGPLGLSAGAPILSDLLEGIPFKCYVMTIITPSYSGTLAGLLFPDDSYVRNFMTQAGLDFSGGINPTMSVDGTYQSWFSTSSSQIIFLKANSPDLKLSDLMPEKVNFFDFR